MVRGRPHLASTPTTYCHGARLGLFRRQIVVQKRGGHGHMKAVSVRGLARRCETRVGPSCRRPLAGDSMHQGRSSDVPACAYSTTFNVISGAQARMVGGMPSSRRSIMATVQKGRGYCRSGSSMRMASLRRADESAGVPSAAAGIKRRMRVLRGHVAATAPASSGAGLSSSALDYEKLKEEDEMSLSADEGDSGEQGEESLFDVAESGVDPSLDISLQRVSMSLGVRSPLLIGSNEDLDDRIVDAAEHFRTLRRYVDALDGDASVVSLRGAYGRFGGAAATGHRGSGASELGDGSPEKMSYSVEGIGTPPSSSRSEQRLAHEGVLRDAQSVASPEGASEAQGSGLSFTAAGLSAVDGSEGTWYVDVPGCNRLFMDLRNADRLEDAIGLYVLWNQTAVAGHLLPRSVEKLLLSTFFVRAEKNLLDAVQRFIRMQLHLYLDTVARMAAHEPEKCAAILESGDVVKDMGGCVRSDGSRVGGLYSLQQLNSYVMSVANNWNTRTKVVENRVHNMTRSPEAMFRAIDFIHHVSQVENIATLAVMHTTEQSILQGRRELLRDTAGKDTAAGEGMKEPVSEAFAGTEDEDDAREVQVHVGYDRGGDTPSHDWGLFEPADGAPSGREFPYGRPALFGRKKPRDGYRRLESFSDVAELPMPMLPGTVLQSAPYSLAKHLAGLMTPNVVTYNVLISMCVASGHSRLCRSVVSRMQQADVPPDRVTLNALLAGAAKERSLVMARSVLASFFEHGVEPDMYTFNTLIPLFSQNEVDLLEEIPQIMKVAASGDGESVGNTDVGLLADACAPQTDGDSWKVTEQTLASMVYQFNRCGDYDRAFSWYRRAVDEYNVTPSIHMARSVFLVAPSAPLSVMERGWEEVQKAMSGLSPEGDRKPIPSDMHASRIDAYVRHSEPIKALAAVENMMEDGHTMSQSLCLRAASLGAQCLEEVEMVKLGETSDEWGFPIEEAPISEYESHNASADIGADFNGNGSPGSDKDVRVGDDVDIEAECDANAAGRVKRIAKSMTPDEVSHMQYLMSILMKHMGVKPRYHGARAGVGGLQSTTEAEGAESSLPRKRGRRPHADKDMQRSRLARGALGNVFSPLSGQS